MLAALEMPPEPEDGGPLPRLRAPSGGEAERGGRECPPSKDRGEVRQRAGSVQRRIPCGARALEGDPHPALGGSGAYPVCSLYLRTPLLLWQSPCDRRHLLPCWQSMTPPGRSKSGRSERSSSGPRRCPQPVRPAPCPAGADSFPHPRRTGKLLVKHRWDRPSALWKKMWIMWISRWTKWENVRLTATNFVENRPKPHHSVPETVNASPKMPRETGLERACSPRRSRGGWQARC